ncbi:MAG: iron-sulfur cluster assembly protein [Candidatus Eisenbacteria bacterium]
MLTRDQIFDALRPVEDPEIGMGVVELGLIYDAKYDYGDEGLGRHDAHLADVSPGPGDHDRGTKARRC